MSVREISDSQLELQLFPGYSEDDVLIFSEFIDTEAKPQPGFVVDFVGSRIRTTSVWKEAKALDGQIIGIPLPADFHAEAIEWIGLLKAVRSATDKFVAMELGAGFGPWIIAGATAARSKGIRSIRLYGVEADPEHFQFLRQHFDDNGFDSRDHHLYEAAVGVRSGKARWPVVRDVPASEQWGDRPIDSEGDYKGRDFAETKEVDVIAMLDLVCMEPYWTLIHIDVQGAEVDICRSCIELLNQRTQWIVAATHSRKLDGDFLEMMSAAGWILEHEKPCKFKFHPDAATLESLTTLDGTQVWRNPRFAGPGDPLISFAQELAVDELPTLWRAGSSYTLDFKVRNIGNQPWFGHTPNAPVTLGYRWYSSNQERSPIEGGRAYLNSTALNPGDQISMRLEIIAPPQQGFYTLTVSMVQEGVNWFYDRGANPFRLQLQVE